VSLLLLSLEDSTQTEKIVNKINEQFSQMKAVESQQLPENIGSVKSIFYFSKIVSVMTLLIAVAVLLNTFIMAISERTKEIGILSAIGWSRQMIIAIFLAESLMLSFGGALVGYLVSYPVMIFLQDSFPSINAYLPQEPTIGVFLNVSLMALLIGLLSVIFPAFYGTKIKIAKAIHHA
jgi:putative ABC transport system permease protein